MLVPGVALIIAGIVFLVVYLFAYWCACCRCCGWCGSATPQSRYKKRGAWIAVVFFALVNLGLILSAIAYLPGFQKGVQGVQDTGKSITTLLGNSADLLTASSNFPFTKLDGTTVEATSVFASMSGAASDAATMATELSNTPCPAQVCTTSQQQWVCLPAGSSATPDPATSDLCSALGTVGSALASSSSASLGAADPFNSAKTQLSAPLDNPLIGTVKQQVYMGGIIVLAVIAGLIALQSLMVCPNRFSCCMFKGLAIFSVILTAIVFLLAGVFFIVGLLGSDVCYDPGATLNSLVGSLDTSGTLAYYLTCSSNPSQPLPAPVTALSAAVSGLNTAQDSVLSLTDSIQSIAGIGAILTPAFNSSLASLETRIPAANASLNLLLTDVVSCPALGGVFITFFNGLCGGFITSTIGLAAILTAAAALLAAQMSAGVSVCCWHPGHAEAWGDAPGSGAGASGARKAEALELRYSVPVAQGASVNY